MAQESWALIELAKGPYEVTPATAEIIADKIRFRHFRPGELLLGKEFIRRCIIPGTYYFDVYLLTEEAIDWMRRQPEAVWRMGIPYAHRIDAVCFTDDLIWLIEFKIRLKYSGIGQLAGYEDWFKRQYRFGKPVQTLVVFWYDRPELHETCKRLRIKMLQMTEIAHRWW